MFLVVGLGNPGKKYERNRHNVGFMVVERLRSSLGLPDFREKFSGFFTKGDALALLEPQTFMNLSGDSVQPAAAFLKVAPANVVVVHDELDALAADLMKRRADLALTRVAPAGSLVVNSSRGGGAKDTWILGED